MRRITFRLFISFLTFAIGVIATTIWFSYHSPSQVSDLARPLPEAQITVAQPTLNGIDPSWVYVRQIEWERPTNIEPNFVAGMAEFAVFYPTGEFASVGCTLYRNRKKKEISISAGDDFAVSKGNWKQTDGTIITTSRLTHAGYLSSSRPLHREQWIIRKQASARMAEMLDRNGDIFLPIESVGNFGDLAVMISDENQR